MQHVFILWFTTKNELALTEKNITAREQNKKVRSPIQTMYSRNQHGKKQTSSKQKEYKADANWERDERDCM